MKKRYWIRAVKIFSLALAILLAAFLLQEYVFREFWQEGQGDIRIKGFYREPRNSLDMVIIGDSTVYAGYSPAYAYKTRGITSYNLAIGANVCTTWESLTREILSRQKPQLVVVDLGGISFPDLREQHGKSSTVHVMLDNMPLSVNKARAIRDVAVGFYGEDPVEYWFPLSRYHNEWASFRELVRRARELFAWKYVSRNALKGGVARVTGEAARGDTMDVRADRSTKELAPESEAILGDYLMFCRKNNVPVVFISVPCRIREKAPERDAFLRQNRGGELVERAGFDYINFNHHTDEIGLEPDRDYYNDAHLNYHGQIKFTEYLVDYLAREYGLAPHALPARQRAAWDRSGEYIGLLYDYAAELETQGEDVLLTERIQVMDALEALRAGKAEQ